MPITATSTALRLPEESDYAYLGYCCYEALLSRPRELTAAYADYMVKRKKVPKGDGKPPGSFEQWRKVHRWDDRVVEHDQTDAERAIALRYEREGDEYLNEIKKHQTQMLQVARSSIVVCSSAKSALYKFLGSSPDVKTWNDASIAARLIAALEIPALQLASDALLIQPLLDQQNATTPDRKA